MSTIKEKVTALAERLGKDVEEVWQDFENFVDGKHKHLDATAETKPETEAQAPETAPAAEPSAPQPSAPESSSTAPSEAPPASAA